MDLKTKIFQSENSNDKETISSLLEENKNLRKENSSLRKALGRFVYEVAQVGVKLVNEIARRVPEIHQNLVKECYDDTKKFMKSKENQSR